MPRVTHVKSARKANPVCEVGQSYYWWKFRHGGKRYSLTYPKPSQLTQSAYYGFLYDLVDQINEAVIDNEEEFESFRDEIAGQMQELYDEQDEKFSNMEEHGLEYTPTGEMVSERRDACENAQQELESFEPDQLQDWQQIAEDQEAHDNWEGEEPDRADFESEEDYDEAVCNWEGDEPEVDEIETADLSEMAGFVEECHI